MLEIATGCPIYITKKAIIIKIPDANKHIDYPKLGKGLFGIEN
jgi:hypothetical protein